MEQSSVNIILQWIAIALISMVGFYVKQLGTRLDKMMPKEMCDILHRAHDDKHVQLEKDVDNVAKLVRDKK